MVQKGLAFLAMFLLLSGTALAAHPLITDDTGTQGRGNFQLELNGERSRDKDSVDGVNVSTTTVDMALAVSAGLGEKVDLVIGVPFSRNRVREDGVLAADDKGFGDLSMELKWRFLEKGGYSLAVKPGVTIPSGDEEVGLGNGRPSWGISLIATREAGPLVVNANASYTRNEYRLAADRVRNRSDIFHGSLSAGYRVTGDLQLVADFGMESNGDHGANTWPAFVIGGLVYSLSPSIDLDLGVKRGVNSPETDLAWLAGISCRF